MPLEVGYKQFDQYRNTTQTLKYSLYEGEYWFCSTEGYVFIGDYVSTIVRFSAFSEVPWGLVDLQKHGKPKYLNL